MGNVVVVNSKGKITRLCDDSIELDLRFIRNDIARVCYKTF